MTDPPPGSGDGEPAPGNTVDVGPTSAQNDEDRGSDGRGGDDRGGDGRGGDDRAGDGRGGGEDRENALVVDGLTKVYDDGTLAVDDVSFSIRQGEFCVLIGPSGCGKSTTLHSIVGTVAPTEGRIVLGGEEVTDVPTYRRDIGLVFQDFQLFPHMSVAENVRYGLERVSLPDAETDERVDDVLALLRLGDIRERQPGELSAGQRQRVALGRSLVLEPELLLLDEPLGDLDYKLQKFMERELLRLHRTLDTTFMYVTHDQTQAMRLGDQLIVMNDGRIEQDANVETVYERPATAFVATFVGDTNVFHGELAALGADGDDFDDGALGDTGVPDDGVPGDAGTLGDTGVSGDAGNRDDDGDGGHGEGVQRLSIDGRATVTTEYGRFAVSTANLRSDPADLVGRELVFTVRPQHLRLDDAAPNTIECTVRDVLDRPGRGTQVVLGTSGREGRTRELQLVTYGEEAVSAAVVDRDETVTVGFDAVDAIIQERMSVTENVDLERDILGE